MIADVLKNYKEYCAPDSLLEKGFAFLLSEKNQSLPDGRYEIEGADCFALVQSYNTVPAKEKRWEAHNRYLDIQYLVSGKEAIGYTVREKLTVTEDQTPKADLLFFQEAEGVLITLTAGTFAIFYPQDAHKPCVAIGEPAAVKKIVVKVRCRD